MKLKSLLALFVLLTLTIFGSKAQLSGTYTIGGTTPDYNTFNEAVTALLNSGVSGPVVFNVRDGVYQEKVILYQFSGVSSTNTITFQSETGDSSAVILTDTTSTASTNNFTLQFNSSDYVTLKQMTIQRTGTTTYANVINLLNSASYNHIMNCRIIGATATTSTTNNCLIYSTSGTGSNDSSNTFTNNLFEGGSYGMYYLGSSTTVHEPGTVISNNIFRNQYARAMYILYQRGPQITNNTVSTNSAYTTFYGLYIATTSGPTLVSKNKITGLNSGGYGLYLATLTGITGQDPVIVNNFIQVGGTGTAYGIYTSGISNTSFIHNSVNVSGTGATSRCFYATGSTTTGIKLLNNVFMNSGGGLTYYIVSTAITGIASSNYNCLYSTGPVLGYWNTANTNTFADWQTASSLDASSVSADPQFYSTTDLHASGAGINDLGIYLSINDDIDGDPRSMTTPDIGADEFVPLADNVGLTVFLSPANATCGNAATSIAVELKNYGLNTQTTIPITVEVTGAITQTINETFSGTLATNSTTTYTFSQTLNTLSGGAIQLTAYTALPGDQYLFNDTIRATRNFNAVPNDPVAASPQVECDNNVTLEATPDSGNVVFWYDQPTGGNLLYIGSPFQPALTTDTIFYVEAREGSGSSGCLRITECELGGSADYVEIQNLSGAALDATGWIVAVSNSYTDINSVNTLFWNLGTFNPGEIMYRTDVSTDNYWGNNILWNPSNNGWAIILDQGGNIIDFAAWGWTATDLQNMNATIAGFQVTLGQEWTGAAAVACATGAGTVSRMGNGDHNDNTDFACEVATKGTQNANLSVSFTNCGAGLCGSNRIPVQVNLIPGVSTSLGNDTVISSPFTITLDAGSGFTAYLWSDNSTNQTLNVSVHGQYWVTVTGANGCTFTDTINILDPVSVNNLAVSDHYTTFPNPTNGLITIKNISSDLKPELVSVYNLSGQLVFRNSVSVASTEISIDLSSLPTGFYTLEITGREIVSVTKLSIIR